MFQLLQDLQALRDTFKDGVGIHPKFKAVTKVMVDVDKLWDATEGSPTPLMSAPSNNSEREQCKSLCEDILAECKKTQAAGDQVDGRFLDLAQTLIKLLPLIISLFG